jgi:dienelactone hydrolase
MSAAKLEAVVTNWYPRFLANGIDWFDLTRTLERVDDWDDWADAWTATADSYENLGLGALAQGHRVTAAEHLRRASLTLQFAQFVLTEQPERRRALQQRMSAIYALCAPLLDPPAERYAVSYDEQRQVVGYLRVPPDTERPGVVPPPAGARVDEGTVQHLRAVLPAPRRRDPLRRRAGTGDASLTSPFRDALYAKAVAAVGAALASFGGIDSQRLVVLGTSFGGYLALRHAPTVPGLRGVVDIAGPYDLRAFDELQEVTRDGFREFVGADHEDEARKLLDDVTLEEMLDDYPAPVLVVHGEQDRIIDVSHAHRIVADLGKIADVRLEPAGNHSCNNVATTVRPAVADWVADRLGDNS